MEDKLNDLDILKAAVAAYVNEVCSIVAGMTLYLSGFLKASLRERNERDVYWEMKPDEKTHLNVAVLGIHFFEKRQPLNSSVVVLAALNRLTERLAYPIDDNDWGILRSHFEMQLWSFIVEKYLDIVWVQHQAIVWDAQIFDQLYDERTAQLDDTTIEKVTLVAPLAWVKLPSDSFVLEEGVRLRTLGASEIEGWLYNSGSDGIGRTALGTEVIWLHSAIEVSYSLGVDEVGMKNFGKRFQREREESEKVSTVLSLLRLITNKDLRIPFIQRESISLLDCRYFFETPKTPRPSRLETEKAYPTGEQLDELALFWRELRDERKFDRIALAFRRWAGAADRLELSDRLIDYWIGLESIFAPTNEQELRFRASLRIAAFLGKDYESQANIFEEMKHSYAWRSAVVHGGYEEGKSHRLDKKSPIGATTSLTKDYLRQVIVKLLQANEPLMLNPNESEFEILRKLNEIEDKG